MKKTKKTSPTATQPGGVEMSKVQAAEYRRLQQRLAKLERAKTSIHQRRDRAIQRLRRQLQREEAKLAKAATLEIKALQKEADSIVRRLAILEGRLAS